MKLSIKSCQTIIDLYEFGKVEKLKRLTSGYTNANFKVKTENGNVLFRICLDKSVGQIEYEMQLLEVLKEQGFPIASPILNKNGAYINHTDSGIVVLYEYIKGKEPVPSPKVNKRIAKAVAKLNKFKEWKRYQRPNPIGFTYSLELVKKLPSTKHDLPEFEDYFIEQTAHLEKAFVADLPRGLIHGDLFTDNTKFKKEKLKAILDFEEACTDSLLIDVGVTINGFCFTNDKLDYDLMAAFLTAYHKKRRLTKEEIEFLPHYIQWGAHSMVSWYIVRLLEKPEESKRKRATYLMNRVKELRKEEGKMAHFITGLLNSDTKK